MADVTELIKGLADPIEQRSLVRGYISTSRPAPTGFTTVGSEENYIWVIVPEHSTEVPYGPCNWAALHGTSLPAQGAACMVALDQINRPVIVWWEGAQSPLLVSALPASPTDGQTIYFQNTAMEAAGVMWTLRYRAASASAYKWEFVGGSDYWQLTDPGSEVTHTESYKPVAVSGAPTFTTPLAGDWKVDVAALILPITIPLDVRVVGGTVGSFTNQDSGAVVVGNVAGSVADGGVSNPGKLTAQAAATVFTVLTLGGVGKLKAFGTTLIVRPIRVG